MERKEMKVWKKEPMETNFKFTGNANFAVSHTTTDGICKRE